MSARRLFVPPSDLDEPRLVITGEAHRHLARVLRARVGERVTLFDGTGGEAEAKIVRIAARATELALGPRRAPASPPAGVAITLLVAIPRGERMDLLVQKTTELGVARIQPVVTGRSVARPDPETARRARWEKIAREAARQCGRADVPAVDEPRALAEALAAELPPRRLALWEGARGTARPLRAALDAGPDAVSAAGAPPATALLVGPEGGLATDEVASAEAVGFEAVALGPRILRVETAAIVAVALVQAAAGGLD